jgi:hydrogenase maturation factor
MHDLKVAIANIGMAIAGFADLDIFIKVVAFILGSVYTIQRIVYNYYQRKEQKKINDNIINGK